MARRTSFQTPCAPADSLWSGCSRCPERTTHPHWPADTILVPFQARESHPPDARPGNKTVLAAESPRHSRGLRRRPFSNTRSPAGSHFSCNTRCPVPGRALLWRDRGLQQLATPRWLCRHRLVASAFALRRNPKTLLETLAATVPTARRQAQAAAPVQPKKRRRATPHNTPSAEQRIAFPYQGLEHISIGGCPALLFAALGEKRLGILTFFFSAHPFLS